MNRSISEYDISDICLTCKYEPLSHSFREIKVFNNISIMYTCPTEAKKYNDKEGILAHYKNILDKLVNRKWIWIVDSKNFSAKHALEVSLGIELAKLVSKYSNNLLKVFIINDTWHIKTMYYAVLPFISKDTKELIDFIGEIICDDSNKLANTILIKYMNKNK
jgi:hypothetical protein